jgi:ribonuclease HI
MIEIYTDGSSRGNPGPGGWGAVIIIDNHGVVSSKQYVDRVIEIGGREANTTNNRMELTAAIRALEFISKANEAKELTSYEARIFTDSEYVMKGMTIWIHNWQRKGWKTANKKPVLNQDLWQELLRLTEGKEIEWKYVAGHSGHKLNDRADEIATSFADDTPTDLYDGEKESYK